MSRRPTVRQADLDRVFKTLSANGHRAASIVVRPGGEVEITTALTTDPTEGQVDDLSAWRSKRARRADQGS